MIIRTNHGFVHDKTCTTAVVQEYPENHGLYR